MDELHADALNRFLRVVAPVDELHADPLPFQLGRQVGDPVAFGQDAGYGVEHLLPHFVRSVQPFGLYVLLTVRECQPVSAFKLFADFDVPAAFILIRHKRPVVFHPVVDNMQVGMFRVVVPGDDILRIGDSHALHVGRCQFPHPIVGQRRRIVPVERQRDMPHDLCDLPAGLALEVEVVDYRPDAFGIYPVAIQQAGFLFPEDILDSSAERFACYDFSYHCYSLFSLAIIRL